MTNGFRVTKRGAFKDKKRAPGEKTKHGAMPDIFKIQKQVCPNGSHEPRILITNESGNWKTELKLTEAPQEMLQLLADQNKIYILALPHDNALEPISMISGQDW